MATEMTDPITAPRRRSRVAGAMLRELTYRYEPKRSPAGDTIIVDLMMNQPHTVAPTLMSLLRDEPVEVFGILCLTTKLQVICWHEVARGCLDSAVVHPREVFKAAILVNAATIIAAHNHPSGDPQPSPEDIDLTRRLSAAGALLGIELLDHLVVGDGSFVSFRQMGRL